MNSILNFRKPAMLMHKSMRIAYGVLHMRELICFSVRGLCDICEEKYEATETKIDGFDAND